MSALPRQRAPRTPLAIGALLCAIGLIAVATLSSSGGNTTSGGPFCLTCSATWLADVIGNVVLFVPLGMALFAVGVTTPRVLLVGAALSLLVEVLQYLGLSAGRTPALADLVSNSVGSACGAWLLCNARWLLAPSRVQARVLTAGWCTLAAFVWALFSLALQPATLAQTRGVVRESPLPFTPGYGWYAVEPVDAVVNGVTLPARGTGAVRVAAERTDTVRASVRVRGRDRRLDVVPIVFVHDPAMHDTSPRTTKAHLLLAQRGEAAWLSSDLKGGRWGLAVPALVAREAFASGRASVVLQATVTARTWQLSWRDASPPTVVHTSDLTLSPLLGWAMVQTVVPVSSPLAPLLTVVWVLCWLVPFGYWLRAALRTT